MSVGSIELWAAAKIIGRECATVNKEFLLCKKYEGYNAPFACLQKGEVATSCATQIVLNVQSKFPGEFSSLVKCLDHNDYRHADCKKQEKALHDCWNKQNQIQA
mmetsp:Transcript_16974/g.37761  ORF Transcript_16974/g.37761 Transcript_16974/m.37761 type:complete len:104 (+) Transcript_16974:51-362(+)|eukprot:CAMPEP_0173203390 /NCGR_PEP_ID=MMETSP1141-20130122/19492_1 /TAXON_ID=483371 /ORGANISM="non described non described, Strain CCMP2298" /LENGTH=103 /DNA_ID=CAMNT_0014128841 /DNA_START=39 /DNA_END=350 /DNA_ORIENTATION=-